MPDDLCDAVVTQQHKQAWAAAIMSFFAAGTPDRFCVQNPCEGSMNLAWDPSGSFLAVCTATGCLRYVH